MNFFNSLSKTCYDTSLRDYVASFVIDHFSNTNLHNIYLVSKTFSKNSPNENIYLIQKTLEIIGKKNEIKIIKILIYLPKLFPKIPPKFFLERASTYSVPDIQKDVNRLTYEIIVNSICNWQSISDYDVILNEIVKSFEKIYPLCKLEINKRMNVNYPEHSYISNNAMKISMTEENNLGRNVSNFDGNMASKIPRNFPIKMQPNVEYPPKDFIQKNDGFSKKDFPLQKESNFSDEEIRKILLDNTIINLKDKYLDIYFQNKRTKYNIDNLKISVNNKINEMGDMITEGNKILKSFENLLKDLNMEKSKIKDRIIANSQIQMNFETFRNFITIPNKEEQMMKLLCMEISLEDMISCIKKFYERNLLKYEESSKLIRRISKEIFIINFLREKLINS